MEDENDLYYGDLNEEVLKTSKSPEAFNEDINIQEHKTQIHVAPKLDLTPIAMPSLHLYPIDNYTFGSKDILMEIDTSYHSRMAHLAEAFSAEGMRRTVEAVLLTYENNHPHVLLLQLGDSTIFKL